MDLARASGCRRPRSRWCGVLPARDPAQHVTAVPHDSGWALGSLAGLFAAEGGKWEVAGEGRWLEERGGGVGAAETGEEKEEEGP